VIVTHDAAVAGHARRVVEMADGVVVRDGAGA
jgi:ABC-type lipoprotein export system ATPase subunit